MSSMLVHIKFTSGKGTEDNGWSKKRGGVRLKKTYKSAKNASTKQSLSWKAWEWWRTTNQSSQSFAVNNGGWLTASSRLESSCTAESEDQSADKTLLIVYKQTTNKSPCNFTCMTRTQVDFTPTSQLHERKIEEKILDFH